MERLQKLIDILRLTPHQQPELVKEATHLILIKNVRSDARIILLLKPLLEILIKYCDTDDSAQRSLFNDNLNTIILAFQHKHYPLVLNVLIDELICNGTARRLSTALLRIPLLINNVLPIELGCEPLRLLKALIEIARRSDNEAVQKSLDGTLKSVMPFLNHQLRTSKEAQFLANSLIEILLRNLFNDSSQIRRIAASSLANICFKNEVQMRNTTLKLKSQLDTLLASDKAIDTNKFVGICLCAKEIDEFSNSYYPEIVKIFLRIFQDKQSETTALVAAFETFKHLLSRFNFDKTLILGGAPLVAHKFLVGPSTTTDEGHLIIKTDRRVILQTNALACLAAMIRHQPNILNSLEDIVKFKNHKESAIRNQAILLIGNYIDSYWRFPWCVDESISCKQVKRLWIGLREIIFDESTQPDTLKSCIISIRICTDTLLTSDHCLDIVEYQDIDRLIRLYTLTKFKPLKIELLNFFGELNYRAIHYLEQHWSKSCSQSRGSPLINLQERIITEVIIKSLTDEHQQVRNVASNTLVALIHKLYVTRSTNGIKMSIHIPSDPIVSWAQRIACKRNVMLDHTNDDVNLSRVGLESQLNLDTHNELVIRDAHKLLTSSIMQPCTNHSEHHSSSHSREDISINLALIINSLKVELENSLVKGKNTIASLVGTLYELARAYPIHEYPSSWDCRVSEYCYSFELLNFLISYLENLTEPDVIVDDLQAYRLFLALMHELLFGLCHESVYSDYESQRVQPHDKRPTSTLDGSWSELTIKHTGIADALQIYFTHLVKLLWLSVNVIEETNPFAQATKTITSNTTTTIFTSQTLSLKSTRRNSSSENNVDAASSSISIAHKTLTSNTLLFSRIHKKLESSFKSSKKNLNQRGEKFYQILTTCLSSISSLLEFIGMSNSVDYARDLLAYLKVTSSIQSTESLVCARQLLKSLFGINIIAIYQVDPHDWFEDESQMTPELSTIDPECCLSEMNSNPLLQGVYHYLITHPYKIISNYRSKTARQNCTPGSVNSLSILNYESRRALKVRRRIEDRVKILFEINHDQRMPLKTKEVSQSLRMLIAEFSPILLECMKQFNSSGFCLYQAESLHFMSYLLLLRVNFHKLPQAIETINSINKLLDDCGDRTFLAREQDIEQFLRNSFTFFTLLTYDRGLIKPMFSVAAIIQKFDDLRAKLSMASAAARDLTTYIVPLLRCLIEDLFIYRTQNFQTLVTSIGSETTATGDDPYEVFEAERETVAQKLFDIVDKPGVYELLPILISESRRNCRRNTINDKKLAQHLLSIIPNLLSKRSIDLSDHRRVELVKRIIENISPEVFRPSNFIFETLFRASKPKPLPQTSSLDANELSEKSFEFHRWMSSVIITMHILIFQVEETGFLERSRDIMSDQLFIEYLLHTAQLCVAEIILKLYSVNYNQENDILFLTQQLSCYLLYITYMFQSGVFNELSRQAAELMKAKVNSKLPEASSNFKDLCTWARQEDSGFSLLACERLFYHLRLIFPDLTISWCNIMSILNNVDCDRSFWRDLLLYKCHHCQLQVSERRCLEQTSSSPQIKDTGNGVDKEAFKTAGAAARGSLSLNLPSNNARENSPSDRGSKPASSQSQINRPSLLNLPDKQSSKRESLIRDIATKESRCKSNKEIDYKLEREMIKSKQVECLSPYIELTRRGVLCVVLDYVTISMSEVESIVWLITQHINDIIRWSHETPVADFINAVHGNSTLSGIFIQAIISNFNDSTTVSYVIRLLWTLEKVHYTQYGFLVVLLIERLLSSPNLIPYIALTRKIDNFACETVQKLLDDFNKSLIPNNDEIVNSLTTYEVDRITSLLDCDRFPKLAQLLAQLRCLSSNPDEMPIIESNYEKIFDSSDDEKDQANNSPQATSLSTVEQNNDEIDYSKVTHDSLLKDNTLLNYYCNRVLKLGWTQRRQFEEIWMTLLGVLSSTLSQNSLPSAAGQLGVEPGFNEMVTNSDRCSSTVASCKVITTLTKLLDLTKRTVIGDPHSSELFPVQSFDDRVGGLARTIASNLPALKKKTATLFDVVESDQTPFKTGKPFDFYDTKLSLGQLRQQFSSIHYVPNYSYFLRIPAHKLRLSSILNVEVDMQDTVVIESDISTAGDSTMSTSRRLEEVDVESCVQLILSIYKQKFNDPNQDFLTSTSSSNVVVSSTSDSSSVASSEIELSTTSSKSSSIVAPAFVAQIPGTKFRSSKTQHQQQQNQLAPPLGTAIVQSILSLSDMFKSYDQFIWMFDSFMKLMKVAERNEDEIQMQYLIVGLCKAATICCYELPSELTASAALSSTISAVGSTSSSSSGLMSATNQHELMFERCRQMAEKYVKSDFVPLKISVLHGLFYMLEDSIDIVASGAWELDDFKRLRQMRFTWIIRLMPIILDKDNGKYLSSKSRTMKLLETLCETVAETELKAMKNFKRN